EFAIVTRAVRARRVPRAMRRAACARVGFCRPVLPAFGGECGRRFAQVSKPAHERAAFARRDGKLFAMHPWDVFGWVGRTLDGKVAGEAVAGEGAFAVVYRGRHLGLDESVAVKCLKIPPQITERDRAGLIAAFRAEARALHRLSRRTASIVQALDLGAAMAPN